MNTWIDNFSSDSNAEPELKELIHWAFSPGAGTRRPNRSPCSIHRLLTGQQMMANSKFAQIKHPSIIRAHEQIRVFCHKNKAIH